jgi:HlyD family secretion protein
VFVPVKVGIAGDRYFEVLEGLDEGDDVITGPFASVRALREGDLVRVSGSPDPATGPDGAAREPVTRER